MIPERARLAAVVVFFIILAVGLWVIELIEGDDEDVCRATDTAAPIGQVSEVPYSNDCEP